jgi:hypothetical protein
LHIRNPIVAGLSQISHAMDTAGERMQNPLNGMRRSKSSFNTAAI